MTLRINRDYLSKLNSRVFFYFVLQKTTFCVQYKFKIENNIETYSYLQSVIIRKQSEFIWMYYCICTVHVIRSLNCQYQHMHNFNVTG